MIFKHELGSSCYYQDHFRDHTYMSSSSRGEEGMVDSQYFMIRGKLTTGLHQLLLMSPNLLKNHGHNTRLYV